MRGGKWEDRHRVSEYPAGFIDDFPIKSRRIEYPKHPSFDVIR